MLVYRISRHKYADDISGTGAGLYGGRWNPVGLNLLYTAGSISLACLEYLAHNFHILSSQDICLSKIKIATEVSVETVSLKNLPNDWRELSYTPSGTQKIGKQFIAQGKHYVLQVPSVIVPDEYNYLLNARHRDHAKTVIKEKIFPFRFDERLFGMSPAR